MYIKMRLNDENKLCAYKGDIVFLWEPGTEDRMYHVALLLKDQKLEENEKYEGTKVLFVETGKVFNVSELDNNCAFYKTMNSNCLHNSFGSFEIYLDKVASKLHKDCFENGGFLKNYLTSIGKKQLISIFANREYEPFRKIPMTEILELSKAVLSIQQELLEKCPKQSKSQNLSLSQQLKEKYLEKDNER